MKVKCEKGRTRHKWNSVKFEDQSTLVQERFEPMREKYPALYRCRFCGTYEARNF